MELAEDLTIGEHVVSSLIHMQEIKNSEDYLNLKKNPWFMPWDGENEINHSFSEMYNQAVAEGVKLIELNYNYLNGKLRKEKLIEAIGNKSMASGLDIDKDQAFYIHGRMAAESS